MQSAAANVEQCVAATEHWMAANRLRLNADKTELIWAGARHNLLKIPGGGPSLTLGGAHIKSSDVVRVLGVLLTLNLSMDKHVTSLSAKCFFQLRQLRRTRRSLGDDSVATLVHAFVVNRVYRLCRSTGRLARRRRRQPSCNVFSTQLRESCQTAACTTEDRLISCAMFYTGSTSLTGSGSDCASRCTSVSTAWLLDTWSTSADLSPASTATNISDLQLGSTAGSGCQSIRKSCL